jgi:hypothetical protein
MTDTPDPEPPNPSTLAMFTPPYLNPGGAAARPNAGPAIPPALI